VHLFGYVLEHYKFLSFVNSAVFHEAYSFGSKTYNGTWTGMMALVSSGVADVGVGEFTVTNERADVVAFIDTVEFSR
jgi:ABC-type amino acid transport substrate-binding protein